MRPGVHGKARRRARSEFGNQLSEKQKIKFSYGLRERQFRRAFVAAAQNPGVTAEMFMRFLERRLDNVVYRLGFAPSRSVARQLVGHGHLLVNGRRVTIPSYEVKIGDVVSIRPQSSSHPLFKDLAAILKKRENDVPPWLKVDVEKIEGKIVAPPKDFEVPFNLALVVDYYSKIVK